MSGNISLLQSRVIDWLRFPLAVAVVLLHAGEISEGVYGPDFYSTLRIILSHGICRIAVPCFFFFSGYLFFSKLEKGWDWDIWNDKIKKRSRTLLLPYILWNVIAFLVFFGYGWLRSRFNASIVPMGLLESLRKNGWLNIFWASSYGCPIDYPLWFIRDLIVFVVITPIIFFYVKKSKIWGLTALFVVCVYLGSRDIEGLFFFAFGSYFKLNGQEFIEAFSKVKWSAYILTVIGLITIALCYRSNPYLYRHLKAPFMLVGVVSVINLARALLDGDLTTVNPFLASSSFFIYASHAILILHDFAHYITLHLLPWTSVAGQCAVLLIKTALAVSICLIIYTMMKRLMPKALNLITGNRG